VQLTTRIRTADLSDPRAGSGPVLSAHGIDVGVFAYPAGGRLTLFTRRNGDGRLLSYRNVPIPSALVGKPEAVLRLALVDARIAAFYGTAVDEWTQIGDVLTVNEMAADVMGGMELSSDSPSRLVTSVRFNDFQAEPITVLPVRAAPTPPAQVAASAASTPAPTAAASAPSQAVAVAQPYVYPETTGSSGPGVGTFVILLIIITLFLIKPFNRLVYLRNRTRKAWAEIDVQLKRRHDLILNYAEAVKGYARHESGTLEGVTRARAAAVSANTVQEHAQAEAALNANMRSLYAVVEAYPELKANENFLSLQNNLKDTEDKLAGARNQYNEEVMTYNTKVQSFPTNLVALIFRFKEREFFTVNEAEQREAPRAVI
jgi:LemA protein